MSEEHFKFGYEIVSSIINPYVKWVMDQAEHSHISTLYFLSRDGELMYEVAKKLKSIYEYKVEVKYLYVSRRALVPTFPTDTLQELFAFMHVLYDKVSVKEFFERFDIYDEDTSTNTITKNYLDNLSMVQKIKILESIQIMRSEAMQYLSYINTSERFAVVDIGWRGRVQDIIINLLDCPCIGFYYYTHNQSYFKRSYLKKLDIGDRFADKIKMLESICFSDHGQVIGYEDGKPIFSSKGASSKFYYSILEGVLANNNYTQSYAKFERFLNYPTSEEIALFKEFKYSHLDCEYNFDKMVQPYTLSELIRVLFVLEKFRTRWNSASYIISNKWLMKIVELVRLIRYVKYRVSKMIRNE